MGFDADKVIEEYLEDKSWLVRENANVTKTFTGLFNYVAVEVLKDYALRKVFNFASKHHLNGDIHIHNLAFSPFTGYCVGWSLERILKFGLKTVNIESSPAKHLDSACDHITNFLCYAQQEWSGAQAVSKVDLYLGVFVERESLDSHAIRQSIQRTIFNLNYPTRIGAQSPFTNFTFLLDTVGDALKDSAIIGGREVGVLGDYLDGALKVFKAFVEIYMAGDMLGRPFTFPIPTVMITDRFDWSGRRWGDLTYEIFKLTATKGSFYFLNAQSGAFDPRTTYAMCCRLTIDRGELLKLREEALKIGGLKEEEFKRAIRGVKEEALRLKSVGGTWTIPDETGSIGVVTINLPRIGFISAGEEGKLFDMLDELVDVSRRVLSVKRMRLEKIIAEKPFDLPVTRTYLGSFHYHFSTIGLIGIPEFLANYTRNPDLWTSYSRKNVAEAFRVLRKLLEHLHGRIKEFEAEDSIPWNIEEVPGEGASYRLALLDYRMFREKIRSGEFFIPLQKGVPFYSNSIVPYYADIPLSERIRLEAEIQPLFNGGVMMHIFLGEPVEPTALMRFVRKITENKIVYFSITPTLTVCLKCSRSSIGVHSSCPYCGSNKVEIWSRIVGYYRPLYRWNPGKKAEFETRIHYGMGGLF